MSIYTFILRFLFYAVNKSIIENKQAGFLHVPLSPISFFFVFDLCFVFVRKVI